MVFIIGHFYKTVYFACFLRLKYNVINKYINIDINDSNN